MQMSLQALREQRGVIAHALQELVNKTGDFTPDDQAKYDKGLADLDQVDASIKRHNDLNAKIAADAVNANVVDALNRTAKDRGNAGAAVYAKWLKGGDRALNEEDWATIRNTMSTTTGAEGGFTVATEVAKVVIDALKAFGGMRRVSNVIQTISGNPMSYPTSDGTSEEGEIIAENVTATDLDIGFGTVGLPVYKFSSKAVAVPIELLQDSVIDIEAFVNARIVTRLGRITNRMFTTGTGTNQPTGAAVAAAVGHQPANGSGNVTTVNYDALVETQHSVDPAYREAGNCKWMFNDATLKKLRQVKDSSGRPIFVPGYEVAVPGGSPDMILGAPVVINQSMANLAASAKPILWGDFNQGYTIRDAMDVTMFRFNDSAYTKKGQVGFMAWMRSGGNLIDVGAVKAFQNSAS
jgi:HK97 family phage major capsid protein